ncbi:HlyD family efflux transporter periplasmic adaptor subunit [Bacteriovorax sp. PP10]|uniref:HlyD family efflux transporter periplasmic adaptor subunit n=1 Tax=Bacteriovorax antarcticus TaxID=3088717 RepID=A0ABU5VQ39_9BACT|nr:HlyD family efflux transporter periplasmic adaptor subunit [Bacteriovorax sp. PP10]MEA9355164.1 HlyD family efflux transporter periplasmic adaptor subunit [Bacteriovorax sp. PP10]
MQKIFQLFLIFFICSCNKQLITPTRGDIVEAVYGLGTVKSEESFSAKVAVTSSVVEFYVIEGQDIKKGQKLLKTDQGAVIYSPFNGRVTDIPFSVKENIFPQTTILSVVNLKKLYLTVSLEQQAIMRIRPNLNAEVSFEFFRNKKLPGKITSIFTAGDQFIAKVELLEWPEGVLPGMTADVAIEIARKKDALLVPTPAIVNGNIIIKRHSKKIKFPVQVGLADLEKAEILSPKLELDDEIILP